MSLCIDADHAEGVTYLKRDRQRGGREEVGFGDGLHKISNSGDCVAKNSAPFICLLSTVVELNYFTWVSGSPLTGAG